MVCLFHIAAGGLLD